MTTLACARGQTSKRRRVEDSGRTSPGPGSGRNQGQNQNQDRLASFHGVKPENEAFRAFVLHKNQTLDIGLYPTAQAAARAHDRKVGVVRANETRLLIRAGFTV